MGMGPWCRPERTGVPAAARGPATPPSTVLVPLFRPNFSRIGRVLGRGPPSLTPLGRPRPPPLPPFSLRQRVAHGRGRRVRPRAGEPYAPSDLGRRWRPLILSAD